MIVLMGVFVKYILGVIWFEGFLFGVIVGFIDVVVVFFVLGI